ncbi:hypothetical protein ES703_15701 [subsurface metagenome]
MNKSYENLDIAIGLEPQSIASTNVTGPYYNMAEYRECLAVTNIGNISAGGTVATQIRQAATSTGESVADLTSRVATVAANVKVKAQTVTVTTGEAADIIAWTIDGTTYTYTAADGGASTGGEFSTTGTTTVTATNILACINDSVLGLDTDKAFATSDAAIVTIEAKNGYYLDSIAETGDFTTIATTKANSYVWFSGEELTTGLPFIATKVTTASNTGICSTVLIRGKKKGAIDEKVGAQYPAAI